MVQGRSDPAQGLTTLAEITDFVGAQPIAKLDVAHPFAVGALLAHGVPSTVADRLPFPLTHRRHDVQNQSSSGRAGVERLRKPRKVFTRFGVPE